MKFNLRTARMFYSEEDAGRLSEAFGFTFERQKETKEFYWVPPMYKTKDYTAIEIDSLDALMNLIDRWGKVVVFFADNGPEILIDDDYLE